MRKIIYILSYLRYAIKIAIRFLFNSKSNRIIIIATPTHGNLGDQAIVYAEKNAIKAILPSHSIIEIENGAYLQCKKLLRKFIKKNDTIVIDGGGNLGTIWPWEDNKITDIISTFSQNKIVVFPQTAFYEHSDAATERIKKNFDVYSQAMDLTVLLRDKESFDFFVSAFPKVKARLCPDIVLSLNQRYDLERKGVLLCFRSDREKVIDETDITLLREHFNARGIDASNTDTVITKSVRQSNREQELHNKWKEFSSAKLVITDRLHAMIFSYITGTPCIALNNSSKKVEGTFRFIKDCNFIKMSNSLNEVIETISYLLEKKTYASDNFEYPMNLLEEALKSH